ncbi:hypothetical protein MRX96_059504 [Rhipicephalus microplus]
MAQRRLLRVGLVASIARRRRVVLRFLSSPVAPSSRCWARLCLRVKRKTTRSPCASFAANADDPLARRAMADDDKDVRKTASTPPHSPPVAPPPNQARNSGGAGDLRDGKMSDPMVYNVLLGLVVVAAVVSVVCFTTLTIVPRAVLAMGMMACIWNVIDNLVGQRRDRGRMKNSQAQRVTTGCCVSTTIRTRGGRRACSAKSDRSREHGWEVEWTCVTV